ncbi:MAG: HD-GYP domain-containing protein, partial [Gammaproteobacteria bacterium]|nr:HD-GYP domain-containing protein [Gammaproteobacteria bacterium]
DKGVLKVSVDLSKSKLSPSDNVNAPDSGSLEKAPSNSSKQNVSHTSFDNEISRASKIYQNAKEAQNKVLQKIKVGEPIDIESVEQVSGGLLDSIQRNKDALACLTRMHNTDDYLLEHSINVAILMGVFADYLELPKEQCHQLITGALLLDVGMIGVKHSILSKTTKLSAGELSAAKGHVELGYKVLKKSKNLPELSLQIVLDHHERLDGSGYPNGKKAEELDQFSRMVAILDSYDAIVSNRPYRLAKTPIASFKDLKNQSDKYDADLVNQFIKCMGIHPVGSLVKLKSNKLGIVVHSNLKNPTAPVIKVFYSVTNKSYIPPKQVNLAAKNCTDEIVKSVMPEEFKLNILKFFKEVLL